MDTRKTLTWAASLAFAGLMAGSAWAQEAVNIGYTGPLSGGAAIYGKNTLMGLEMAADEINKSGGFEVSGKKYTLNVIPLDDKYAPSLSAVNAKRLRAQNNAPIIFTPHSGGAFALQAFNEADGFILGAYTSIPSVTERGNKLTLRIPPSFVGYVEPFVREQMKRYGKKLGVAAADHDYAKTWTEVFVEAWKKAGGEVVSVNLMSYNKDTDFYSGVSRVLAASPDVMFVGGASEPTALVVRQARELGFKGGFAVMDQAKLDEMARVVDGLALLEGAIGVMPLVHDKRPGAEDFVARFRKLYNRDPGSEMSYHYSALNAVVEAMKLSGNVSDPSAIYAKMNEAYGKLSPQQNPSRISGIDERGGSNAQIIVGIVEKGVIVPIGADKTN
jgi:branched-chain amino acid transport system substrate-binding protein